MKRDWISCDGTGVSSTDAHGDQCRERPLSRSQSVRGSGDPAPRVPRRERDGGRSLHGGGTVTRRRLLAGTALATVAWAAREATALAQVGVSPGGGDGNSLVVVFLRGGADGLNIIPPYAEDAYHRARPGLRVAPPSDRNAPASNRALDLDGFFGLHPALASLLPLYREGQLGFVHAVGSGDHSRSHFEAMATMERGLGSDPAGSASGWIARHLSAAPQPPIMGESPLRAVAFSNVMPDSLRGATNAAAMNSLAEFRLFLPESHEHELHQALASFYAEGKDAVAHAGRETLAVLDALNRLDPARYRPENGAVYPNSYLGNGLKQVACLVKGSVGLEVAALDRGGWDMHAGQNVGGWMTSELTDVGKCIAAFAADLRAELHRVTLVVMTEFGRRLVENSALGTDHGRASMMMLVGGGVNGGKVHRAWPGLETHQLEDGIDLRVTTDYRDVLAELLTRRFRNSNLAEVFPGYTPRFPGIVRA